MEVSRDNTVKKKTSATMSAMRIAKERQSYSRPMLGAMCLGTSLAMFHASVASADSAAPFPIQNANDAIATAKDVCLRYGGPFYDEDDNRTTIRQQMLTLKWNATLEGDHWHADTRPSVVAGTNEHWLDVDIPVNGPAPTSCAESMYELIGIAPVTPKPRGPCKPSDLSEWNAQELALEAVAPNGGVWLMASRGKSEPSAWIVSVHIPERPESDASADKGLFKVFKRNGDVLNVRTGEFFTSLPSKAHFVEHHCLDQQPLTK